MNNADYCKRRDEILVNLDLAEASPQLKEMLHKDSLGSEHVREAAAAIDQLVSSALPNKLTLAESPQDESFVEGYNSALDDIRNIIKPGGGV